ncbi:hypothetical protein RirG_031760 [Rhizophagus irregularis DAOM 197198w]|uniref:Uncharacterized protein n=1 Tax=Rhizophagus irregularis (strain DAOM 197198w) TaxID=1432141 RepID=A0A015LV81_RHIIW|nr:hypothetical protein RirG_031760 [Rhizophagus irregularis DAOM 197198w]
MGTGKLAAGSASLTAPALLLGTYYLTAARQQVNRHLADNSTGPKGNATSTPALQRSKTPPRGSGGAIGEAARGTQHRQRTKSVLECWETA